MGEEEEEDGGSVKSLNLHQQKFLLVYNVENH